MSQIMVFRYLKLLLTLMRNLNRSLGRELSEVFGSVHLISLTLSNIWLYITTRPDSSRTTTMLIYGWMQPHSSFLMRKTFTLSSLLTMNCLTNSKLRTRSKTQLLTSSWCKLPLVNKSLRKVGMMEKRMAFCQEKGKKQSLQQKILWLLLPQTQLQSLMKYYPDSTPDSFQSNSKAKTLK